MNPPMQKDTAIWVFLGKLASEIGGHKFQVVDHWDADLCAVGIASLKNPRRLVYVSTYNSKPGRYSYECEKGIKQTSGFIEDASLGDLLKVIQRHLK